MAFPPAHLLVGAGVAEVVRGVEPLPRWRAWALGAFMAVLPDGDFILGLLQGTASAYHGTFTHSIAAAVVAGLLVWALAGARWGVVAALGYGSHLLVDLLDDRGRTNVLLAWPFSDRQPFAIAKIFPTVPFEQGHGFWHAFFSLFRPEVFLRLLEQSLIGAAFAAGLFLLGWVLRRTRRARG